MAENVSYDDFPWFTKYKDGVNENVNYIDTTIPAFLDESAARFPRREALVFQGYSVTFDELLSMINKFAGCLTDFGVKKGDVVSILLPNIIPCVASYYAVLKTGAICVMNNPLYSDRELKHQFNDSGSKILITLDLLADRMVKLRPQTGIKQIVYTSIGDYLPFPKNFLFKLVGKKKKLAASVKPAMNLFKWKKTLEGFSSEFKGADLSFDDVAMYQYTGGTTGVAKGAVLTHGNLSRQVQQISAWFPDFKKGEEIMLGALPFFHVFGLSTSMNFAIHMGWTNVLVPKPQPEPLIDAITKFKVTFAPLVPTMYIGILNLPDIDTADMTSIKGCFSGSAPLPLGVIKDFEKRTGSVIVEGYGLTESSPVTHINPFDPEERKVGSIGIPISDVQCRIVDLENGETNVPVGESGELLIKGPQVMREYLNMESESKQTLKDGWLCTGDIAVMDEDGFFFIVDRKKDMVLSGGYNVYPRDIDEVFFSHPKVQEACSIGIPHSTRGEAVKTFVVLKQGEIADATEMIDYCKSRLAKYKWPIEIEFRDELPKSTVGKILRKDLRQEEMGKTDQDQS